VSRRVALLLGALALAPGAGGGEPVALARDGRALLPVVLAAEPTPAERTAAEELVTYLGRASGGSFTLVEEAQADPGRPAIHVGPTTLARRLGLAPERLGAETWRIRTAGGSLLLAGGRPRGTLYAVYRFLEDQVGVRWWTPFEEHVPARPDLVVAAEAGGRPAFAFRDVQGVEGPAVFHARQRASGHHSFLSAAHGGREAFGPPFLVHTFFLYVPPAEFFAVHPELYTEEDGERKAEQGQLCLSNDALVDLVLARLEGFVVEGRARAEDLGEAPPRLYDLSQNDYANPCRCDRCRAIDEAEGGHSGSVVRFVNRVAERAAERHPDLRITTLAYRHTFEPPRRARVGESVVLRLAALFQRDFARPVTHRANRNVERAIRGWAARTRHLWIWDYTVTFGRKASNLPLPNLPVVAADFRHYRRRGVEGLFVQHEHPVLSDMRDLKLWVLFKLVEDPTRDLDALVRDFTDGYYGAAGATVREYLAALEQATRRKPPAVRYPASYEQFVHLDPPFLRHAQALFDRAEREVAQDARRVARLRAARLSLDRATLWRWDAALAAERAGQAPALHPREVAERLRQTAEVEIERRLEPHRRAEERERLDAEIEAVLRRIGASAAPA
jgi:hypothetical protein